MKDSLSDLNMFATTKCCRVYFILTHKKKVFMCWNAEQYKEIENDEF